MGIFALEPSATEALGGYTTTPPTPRFQNRALEKAFLGFGYCGLYTTGRSCIEYGIEFMRFQSRFYY